MSSTPTAQPQDFNAATATPQEIADHLAQQATQEPPAPPKPEQVYEFKTSTGQVFRGKNYTEVINELIKSVENGTSTIADLNKKIKEIPPPQSTPTPQATPAKPSFDQNRYFELLANDPIGAQDYLDEIRYGVKPAEIRKMVEESYGFVQNARPQVEISNWMASSDIQSDNPEALAAFQKAWTDLGLTDADINQRNLNLVHGYCKGNGLYPGATPPPTATTGPVTQPLPTASSSGGNQPEPEFDALKATPEQIRAYLESKNPQTNSSFF